MSLIHGNAPATAVQPRPHQQSRNSPAAPAATEPSMRMPEPGPRAVAISVTRQGAAALADTERALQEARARIHDLEAGNALRDLWEQVGALEAQCDAEAQRRMTAERTIERLRAQLAAALAECERLAGSEAAGDRRCPPSTNAKPHRNPAAGDPARAAPGATGPWHAPAAPLPPQRRAGIRSAQATGTLLPAVLSTAAILALLLWGAPSGAADIATGPSTAAVCADARGQSGAGEGQGRGPSGDAQSWHQRLRPGPRPSALFPRRRLAHEAAWDI